MKKPNNILPGIKPFTATGDPEIENKVRTDIERIVKYLMPFSHKIESVVLVGGFGRGEGSVLKTISGPLPANDYDIVIISNAPLDHALFESLGKKIAQKLGTRFIDFLILPKGRLNSLPFTTFNYDLKYGGRTIFGNPDILQQIPSMDPAGMPVVQGMLFLVNHLISLLEGFQSDFPGRQLTDSEKFNLVYYTNKAVLACCEALLIIHRQYHHSIHERNIRFQKLAYPSKNMKEFVDYATGYKLRPSPDPGHDVIRYWFDIKSLYLDTLLYSINKVFVVNEKFENFYDFRTFYSRYSHEKYKSNLVLAEIFTLLSINDGVVDRIPLECASGYLRQITDMGNENGDWESIRRECIRLWMKFHHKEE